MMAVDPSDDCTFWYTQNTSRPRVPAGWKTRIGAFKFPSAKKLVQQAPALEARSPQPAPWPSRMATRGSPFRQPGFSAVNVDGTNVGKVSSYTFNNVTADHSISAVFVQQHDHYQRRNGGRVLRPEPLPFWMAVSKHSPSGKGVLFDHGERIEELPEGQLVDALLARIRGAGG